MQMGYTNLIIIYVPVSWKQSGLTFRHFSLVLRKLFKTAEQLRAGCQNGGVASFND